MKKKIWGMTALLLSLAACNKENLITDLGTLTASLVARSGETLTGTLNGNYKISIAPGATVVLRDVNITRLGTGAGWAGINCAEDAVIVLEGKSTVCGGFDTATGFNKYPGIHVPENKTLTIRGEGSLTAYGNNTGDSYGAGIGGGYDIGCGNIIIESGTINAQGGEFAAGIGSGLESPCGDITIAGGTVVAAAGGEAAGIGSGYYGDCGDITITDGVVCVTTIKASYAPYSIGAGYKGTCGTITIGGADTGDISESPFTYRP